MSKEGCSPATHVGAHRLQGRSQGGGEVVPGEDSPRRWGIAYKVHCGHPPPRAFLGFPPSSPSAVPPRSLSDSATETLTPVSLHWVQEGAVACQPLSAGHRGGRQGLGEFDEWEQDMEKVPD